MARHSIISLKFPEFKILGRDIEKRVLYPNILMKRSGEKFCSGVMGTMMINNGWHVSLMAKGRTLQRDTSLFTRVLRVCERVCMRACVRVCVWPNYNQFSYLID